MALIRLFCYLGGTYGFYILAFPQWTGQVYHVASLAILAGLAVGVFLLLKIIDISSALGKLAIELSFALGAVLYFGYTMPQKSGKPPIQQWVEGHRPTRSDARDGAQRLGLNPNSKAVEFVINLFPKH